MSWEEYRKLIELETQENIEFRKEVRSFMTLYAEKHAILATKVSLYGTIGGVIGGTLMSIMVFVITRILVL